MTLSLRASDRAGLRSMEKWSNSVVGWSDHPPLFYQNAAAAASMFPQVPGEPPGWANAAAEEFPLEESPRGSSLDSLLKSTSSSMVDSSTSEMTGGGEDDTGHCGSAATSLEPRMNCGGGGISPPPTLGPVPLPPLHQQQLRSCKEVFCLEPESPGGPLSPGALQTANCSRGESEDSLGGGGPGALKRPFEEEEEAWMEQLMRSRKLPKQLQENFQEPSPAAVLGYPSGSPRGVEPPLPPFAAGGFAGNPLAAAGPNPAAAAAAILFRAPALPALTALTMEEIANSRPKRRNVRISKDPQSVAARHRRERISDRIRVLQRLVPGGTKMDTASMLDEAIHYVKFLKLQLQTLEQLGNSCDPRFMSLLPQLGNGPVRPFDLNCAAFQGGTPSAMQVHPTPLPPPATQPPSTTWPSVEAAGPFCGQAGFPDPIQEQFCH